MLKFREGKKRKKETNFIPEMWSNKSKNSIDSFEADEESTLKETQQKSYLKEDPWNAKKERTK